MPTQLPQRAVVPPVAVRNREVPFLLLELAIVLLGLVMSLDLTEYGPLLHQTVQGFLLLGT